MMRRLALGILLTLFSVMSLTALGQDTQETESDVPNISELQEPSVAEFHESDKSGLEEPIFSPKIDPQTQPQVLVNLKIIEISLTKAGLAGLDVKPLVPSPKTPAIANMPMGNEAAEFLALENNEKAIHVLEELQKRSLIHVVLEPSLSAVDGQTAKYRSGYMLPSGGSPSPNGTVFPGLFIGSQFYVTPEIREDQTVRLQLHCEETKPDPTSKNVPGVARFAMSSTLDIHDKEIVVLAGPKKRVNMMVDESMPGIGKLPWVGKMFHTTKEKENEIQCFAIVRAEIIPPETVAPIAATVASSSGTRIVTINGQGDSAKEIRVNPVEYDAPPTISRSQQQGQYRR